MSFCVLCRNLPRFSLTLQRLVEHEIRAVFIDCVVRQMHKHILKVVTSRLRVRLSCQPGQSLLIHKNS